MQLDGIQNPALPTPTYVTESAHVQEISAYAAESTTLNFTDGAGNAFNLSLTRKTAVYSLTYDRSAQLSGPAHCRCGDHGRGYGQALKEVRKDLRELNHELKDAWEDLRQVSKGWDEEEIEDLRDAFREMRHAVNGFKKLLHHFLKRADRGYADSYRHHDPVAAEITAFERQHVEITAVQETVRIEMDVVDPGYWSVENTADRLADFAIGLYPGDDREAHAAAMAEAMERGYEEARAAFDGWLPDISRQTLDLAKVLLQEWAVAGPEQDAEDPGPLDLVA